LTNAQIEEHYHSFTANIAVPVIVDHQEVWEYKNGDITEKHIPDKPIYVSLFINAKDIRVKGNNFSGIIIFIIYFYIANIFLLHLVNFLLIMVLPQI